MTSTLRPLRSTYALGALAGLSLVGTLAGCAATTATTGTGDSGSGTSSDGGTGTSTDSSSSDATASSGTYTDGTYTADGSYTSPAGMESVSVELTLAAGVVTAVTVTPEADDAQAKRYQTEFADGISAVVVGKDIDSLDVSRVAGSSLTSGGFNKAVDEIKADAQA